MCTIYVEYYNCSNPKKCLASYKMVQCPDVDSKKDCGHNKPNVDYGAGGYLRVETYAVGLCGKHRERDR
ncbi:hypothetical protein CHU98_g5225 [Xylaria longipes]|nr:hypothetical protein CHU98_g5225 [Xylaria longipes]